MTGIDSGTDWIVTLVKGTENKELAIRSSTADGAAEYAKLVVEHQPQDYAGFLTWVTPDHLCPDLLRWENIGVSDGLRGRVVRTFFWIMRIWPPRHMTKLDYSPATG